MGNKKLLKLKEKLLTQCKETKNLEKRLDEMLSRITSMKKDINNIMALKNTAGEHHEAYTTFNSQIDQVEERIS